MAKVLSDDVDLEEPVFLTDINKDGVLFVPPKSTTISSAPVLSEVPTRIGAKVLSDEEEPEGFDLTQDGRGIIGQMQEKEITVPSDFKPLIALETVINEDEDTEKEDGFVSSLMDAVDFFTEKAKRHVVNEVFQAGFRSADVVQAGSTTVTSMAGGMAGLTVAAGTLPVDIVKAYLEEEHKVGSLSEDNFRVVQGFFTDIPETARSQKYSDAIMEYTFGLLAEAGEFLADRLTPGGPAEEFANNHLYESEDFNQQTRGVIHGMLRATPDLLLSLLPLKFSRGKAKATQGDSPPVPHKTPRSEGYVEAKVRVGELLDLDGRIDPKNMTPENAAIITKEIADAQRGQLDPVITVLRREGKPVEIIGGKGTLFALEKGRGYNLKNVEIRYVDEIGLLSELERVAAQQAIDEFDTFNVVDRGVAIKEGEAFADKMIQETTNPGYISEKALYGLRSKEGIIAKDYKNLQAGASGHAKIRFLDAHDNIYSGLQSLSWVKKGTLFDKAKSRGRVLGTDGTPVEFMHKGKARPLKPREALDFLISQKRDIMIGDALRRSDPKHTRKGTLQAIKRGARAEAAYKKIASELDPRILTDLNNRASKFFEATLDNAKRLHEEGIMPLDEFMLVKELDYVRANFAQKHIEQTLLKGERPKGTPTTASGLPASAVETIKRFGEDSELLLTDAMYRTEYRIARNKANIALKRVLEKHGEEASHIGRVAKERGVSKKTGKMMFEKPKRKGTGKFASDEVTLKVWENGAASELIVNKNFADSWNRTGHDNLSFFLNQVRVASGTQMVKMIATGLNPGFALISLPMDTIHTYFANSGVYSKQPYIYLGQLGRDLVTTGKDAFLRKGRYREYLKDGGAPDFRTSQGYLPQAFKESQIARKIVNPRISKMRYYLGYAGESAEVWVRLAVRERVLRNARKAGMPEDPIHASAVARSMIDYSQSGRVVRILDSLAPYFSAGTQAARTFYGPALRARQRTGVDGVRAKAPFHKSDSMRWAQATLGAMGTATVWEVFNELYNGEAHRNVNFDDRARFTIIHTGMSFEDDYGTRRDMVVKLKKDPSSVPFNALAVAGVRRLLDGEAPPQSNLEYLADAFPIPGKGAIPILQAFQQYANDKDFWNNDAIWGGRTGIDPELEFRLNTHPLTEFFAQQVGTSPVRTRKVIDTLIPKNTILGVGDLGFRALQKIVESEEDVRNIWNKRGAELWANFPVARRVLDLTHPIENDILAEDEQASELANQAQGYDNTLTKLIDKRRNGSNINLELESLFTESGEKHSPQMMQRLLSRSIMDRVITETYKTDKSLLYRAPVRWWIHTHRMEPAQRAEVFYEKWRKEDSDTRRKMERMAAALSETNYATPEFWQVFSRQKNERGTDQPVSDFDFFNFSDELTH